MPMTPWVVALAAWNAAVFLLFAWDKQRARRGGRRVPESWLLVPSACGACVGAWLACAAFRHKTRKQSFRAKLVLATALNALWVWLWWRARSA